MPKKGEQAGDEITAMARRLVALHPEAPAKTLGRRLAADTGNAITLDQAYQRIRYVLGVKGAKVRKNGLSSGTCVARPPRKPGQGMPMPRSKAEPWGPHDLGVTGLVGVLSDIHVPYHDEIALRAAVDQLLGDRIDGLVLNGDVADFYSISRYTKDPRKRRFKAEVDAVREMLAWLRGKFPEIPIVFKAGNHEERWNAWLAQHAPELADDPRTGLGEWLEMSRFDITLVEDQRPIMAGKLPIMHGHEKGKGISAPVNQARGAFLRLHHTVLEGHGHRTSAHCEPDMFGREIFCWSTGCLCDLRPEYARINKFNHGFATVLVEGDGQFNVENFRIADGKVRSS
jgi:predicted phosphodiesterase